jgi:hypothetical protein
MHWTKMNAENQLIRELLSSSKAEITFYKVLSDFDKVLSSAYLSCEDEVKLLGVTIDFKLNFNAHISNICKKAARQLNVLFENHHK